MFLKVDLNMLEYWKLKKIARDMNICQQIKDKIKFDLVINDDVKKYLFKQTFKVTVYDGLNLKIIQQVCTYCIDNIINRFYNSCV